MRYLWLTVAFIYFVFALCTIKANLALKDFTLWVISIIFMIAAIAFYKLYKYEIEQGNWKTDEKSDGLGSNNSSESQIKRKNN
jgi:uncharacterized membrane protein YoaK (UPF0700 family)